MVNLRDRGRGTITKECRPAGFYDSVVISADWSDKYSDEEAYEIVYEITSIENELVLVGYYNGEKQFSEIIRNHLYYVRTGFRSGSIQLVSGFEECKYLFCAVKITGYDDVFSHFYDLLICKYIF